MLDDSSYQQIAWETVNAFEAEVEQHPFLFVGLLAGVVMGRVGVKGVLLLGDEDAGELVREGVRRVRRGVWRGRTVVRVGRGTGGWVRGRNGLLKGWDGGREGVVVCEGGVCREGVEWV